MINSDANIPVLFFDADSLVYRNAWAAQQTHYQALFKGQEIGDPFRCAKDYKAFVAEQPAEKQPFYSYEKIEHVLAPEVATTSIDKAIFKIRKKFGANKMYFFLTDKERSNFRYDLATLLPYKAHRGEKPKYYMECRQHLIDTWNADVVIGEEADDRVAQAQWPHYEALMGDSYSDGDITAIVHMDKDINMVPGYHIRLDTHELYYVNEVDAWRMFYTQLITGDKQVDNIPGFYHITGKKAVKKYKDPLLTMDDPEEMFDFVYALYDAYLPEQIPVLDEDGEPELIPAVLDDILYEIGNLLWMRRVKGEAWTLPKRTK